MITQFQYSGHQNRPRSWVSRIAIVTLMLMVGLVVTMFFGGRVAKAKLIKQYPAPGQLVAVNGHQMHINCLGQGSPTVILDTGLRGFSTDWSLVQPEIARFSRVCAYDRAGYGWSEPGPNPRTSEAIVNELHTLLANAGVEKPYLLVGHYFGGLNMRLYAHDYPNEVVGMVLVDSVHEEQDIRIPAYGIAGEQLARQFRFLALLRDMGILSLFPEKIPNPGLPDESYVKYRAILATTPFFETSDAETQALQQSFAEFKAMPDRSLGDLPLIVLSRGLNMSVPGLSQVENDQNEQEWQEMQEELAALSTNSISLIAEKSGHDIALQQPELVVKAIWQLIDQFQSTVKPPAPTNTVVSPSSKPPTDRLSTATIQEQSPTVTPEPTSAAALVEVTYTLLTIYQDGKMLYEGVGGDIDGIINPTLLMAPGMVVRAILVNGDGMTHDLYFPDFQAGTTKIGRRGQTAEVTFTVGIEQTGDYIYYCTLPGHREAGQQGRLIVIQNGGHNGSNDS